MNEFLNKLLAWLESLGAFALANLLPALLITVVGILVIRLVMKMVCRLLEKSKIEKLAFTLIKAVINVLLYLLLALIVASRLGIDVTGIVALASVLTLAISLAVQDALTNLIGGFTLIHTKPFQAGDFVEVGGQSGTVQSLGLFYTRLTTADNKLVSIPNSKVVSAEIVNFSVTGTRRVDITVSASYDAPAEKVLEALCQAGKLPTVLEEPAPFAAVKNYGDNAVEYVLQVWCKTEDYWTTLFNTNQNIKTVFDANGIEMTYPHLNVHLDK